MADSDPAEWPHTVLLLGDQVYADEVSPDTLEFIRSRRDTSEPPGETIADFEEYTRLYREAWSDPPIRWLLSTVPSAMIFDDHDVIDDWNTSIDWVDEMRATDWWDRRVVGAFMAYALYQHWGNLPPDTLEEDPVFRRVRDAGDGGDILAAAAYKWDREVSGVRWSYCRDVGRTAGRDDRLACRSRAHARRAQHGRRGGVAVDHRARHRRLRPPRHRHLAAADHGARAALPRGLERGRVRRRLGQAWPRGWGRRSGRAPISSTGPRSATRSRRCARCCARSAPAGAATRRPASSCVSGDVHHAYLAEVGFPAGSGVSSRVWQATCSPFRNPLSDKERRGVTFTFSAAGKAVGRVLARLAGVPRPPVRWRFQDGDPRFDNQVGTLELDGRRALARLERAKGDHERPDLELADEHSLA